MLGTNIGVVSETEFQLELQRRIEIESVPDGKSKLENTSMSSESQVGADNANRRKIQTETFQELTCFLQPTLSHLIFSSIADVFF